MSDCMTFPDTVEEFMEQYKMADTEHVYSNGTEYVPIFRMKQWFEHLPSAEPEIKSVNVNLTLNDEQMEYIIEQTRKQLSTERKTGKWTPCSEWLPNVGRNILMSVGGIYTAEGCLNKDGDWVQFRGSPILKKDMVDAWMPLPEPYREEQE